MTLQRHVAWFAVAPLLALGCAGCVGQRNAVKSQEELRATTQQALVFANSLEKAMDADRKAHAETRATLSRVLAEWQERRSAAARLPILEARSEAILSIQSNLLHTMQSWQSARHEAEVSLEQELSGRLASWGTAARDAEDKAVVAAEKAAAFPNDLQLALACTNARLEYTAIAALYNTTELRARTNFVSQWNARSTTLTARLVQAADTQRQTVEKACADALLAIRELQAPDFDLGPEPAHHAELMGDFIRYLEAVELTSEATRDYLESNSLGKGSFFHSAIKAFGKGFFSALPVLGSGKGATLEEVKSSGKDLLQAAQIEFANTAKLAATTAQTTMAQVFQEALSDANGAMAKAFDVADVARPGR
jgi:hypothetical protein